MSSKKIFGIILVVLAVLMIAVSFMEIYFHMDQDGPYAHKFNTYREPYHYHFFVVLALFIAGFISFLVGLVCIRVEQK
ncbi:MAG: hypothetical protein II124_01025 [Clostridia bacterium]|nr:hypothetical protein [Clostridia bacterium]